MERESITEQLGVPIHVDNIEEMEECVPRYPKHTYNIINNKD
jgi:hypothetical protein